MRLWHKDLIPVLPRQQLLGQWRECCMIAKNISENGTPNHLLVNKIMEYPIGHFWNYGLMVAEEMKRRGYKCEFRRFQRYFFEYSYPTVDPICLFAGWHNLRYLRQCFSNLQEKFDCGGIPVGEWATLCEYVKGVDLE